MLIKLADQKSDMFVTFQMYVCSGCHTHFDDITILNLSSAYYRCIIAALAKVKL